MLQRVPQLQQPTLRQPAEFLTIRQPLAAILRDAARMACAVHDHPADHDADDYHHRARVSHRTLPDCLGLTLRSQTLWRQIARNVFE